MLGQYPPQNEAFLPVTICLIKNTIFLFERKSFFPGVSYKETEQSKHCELGFWELLDFTGTLGNKEIESRRGNILALDEFSKEPIPNDTSLTLQEDNRGGELPLVEMVHNCLVFVLLTEPV